MIKEAICFKNSGEIIKKGQGTIIYLFFLMLEKYWDETNCKTWTQLKKSQLNAEWVDTMELRLQFK